MPVNKAVILLRKRVIIYAIICNFPIWKGQKIRKKRLNKFNTNFDIWWQLDRYIYHIIELRISFGIFRVFFLDASALSGRWHILTTGIFRLSSELEIFLGTLSKKRGKKIFYRNDRLEIRWFHYNEYFEVSSIWKSNPLANARWISRLKITSFPLKKAKSRNSVRCGWYQLVEQIPSKDFRRKGLKLSVLVSTRRWKVAMVRLSSMRIST